MSFNDAALTINQCKILQLEIKDLCTQEVKIQLNHKFLLVNTSRKVEKPTSTTFISHVHKTGLRKLSKKNDNRTREIFHLVG